MERTLMMIKPDAMAKCATGAIIAEVQNAGFTLCGLRMMRLTVDQAKMFYKEHNGRVFFDGLIEFMSSGPIVALLLERENAVTQLRELVGSTDAREAAPGTIRATYGTDNRRNAVHASDSVESATREAAFFFSETDILSQD